MAINKFIFTLVFFIGGHSMLSAQDYYSTKLDSTAKIVYEYHAKDIIENNVEEYDMSSICSYQYSIKNTSDHLIWIYFDSLQTDDEYFRFKRHIYRRFGDFSLADIAAESANFVFQDDNPTVSMISTFFKPLQPEESFDILILCNMTYPKTQEESWRQLNNIIKNIHVAPYSYIKEYYFENVWSLNQLAYKKFFIVLPIDIFDKKKVD